MKHSLNSVFLEPDTNEQLKGYLFPEVSRSTNANWQVTKD